MARSDSFQGTSLQVTTPPDAGPKLYIDSERRDTDREELYLDKTLVLVGCGKAKRDPTDEGDLRAATVASDEVWGGIQGPAWRAEDLYTSSYFSVKRELAEVITRWAQSNENNLGAWAVLSAKYGVIPNWKPVPVYDTTVDDLGADPTNPGHRIDNSLGRRRPDGREIVTEMDRWAASVAYGLSRWVAGFRDGSVGAVIEPNKLLVLAGSSYTEPLVERGVFKYGISRMAGNPNIGYKFPLQERFLFDEIDAGGIGGQMGWMSEAIERLEPAVPEEADTDQPELGSWTGDERVCTTCNHLASEVDLKEYGDTVYCKMCAPEGQCNRCGTWTHQTGLGIYPLCSDCQTNSGGQKHEPVGSGPASIQTELPTDSRPEDH